MRNRGMSKLHYLLSAVLIFALTGCGASNMANLTGSNNQPGSVAGKLVYGTGKSVASAPAGITSIQVTVTGTDNSGSAIPVVRGTIDATTNQGTIPGIYPGKVSLVVKAFTGTTVSFEGFATGVVVNPSATTTLANPIQMSAPVEKAQDSGCIQCHETTLDVQGQNLVADFKQSGHYTNSAYNGNVKYGITGTGCAGCHGPSHQDPNPSQSGRCYECHGPVMNPHHVSTYTAGTTGNTCVTCHQPHQPLGAFQGGDCVLCHAFPQDLTARGDYVNDNNGVRAITTEFQKWSHHVTGVTLNAAHCAACHMEGKISNGKVVIDTTKHMADAKVHLRNVDSDVEFAWDPMNPNLSGMDNFCLSCHDANGATSAMSAQIQGYINDNGINAAGKTASASNPFGDTISNRYDKLQRPAVTNANDQFNTTNNSHHGVKGARYTGRTRFAGVRQIASAGTFANNSSAALQGKRSTIYDAGNFNALYVPLGTDGTAATGLGDDSTLHCGDCHTVGQWKPGVATNMAGALNTVAIGAHGSNNEYLLRNNMGTDARHSGVAYTVSAGIVTVTNPNSALLVCFNCHSYGKYGSVYNATGLNFPSLNGQPHAGEYDVQGRCNGAGNTIPFNGYTTGTATDGSQFASRFMGPVTKYSSTAFAGEQNPDFGNIFGIACLNCHNSGYGNAYGGIHGSANNTAWNNGTTTIQPNASVTGGAYIDGMGNTNKVERFLPGLGNAMHVPGTLGGFTGGSVVPINTAIGPNYTYITGGISNDTNWEQKHWQQTATSYINPVTRAISGNVSAGAGCYTLGATQKTGADIVKSDVTSGLVGPSVTGAGGAATEAADTWGGCDDHTAGQGKGNHGFFKAIIRPITY